MIKRLLAVTFIFCCTTVAWMILGSTIAAHTNEVSNLRETVADNWGEPQIQKPPSLSDETGSIPIESSNIDAALDLDYRQKGLLWYSTYKVTFAGVYEFVNASDKDREVTIQWPFPAQKAIYDDVSIARDDRPLSFTSENGMATASATLAVSGGIKGSHFRRAERVPAEFVALWGAHVRTRRRKGIRQPQFGFVSCRMTLADSRPSRAVSRKRSIGTAQVFEIRPDGLDHEIEFVGAVDLPGHAVVLVGRDDEGFGEVIQPVNPSGRVVFHDEHNTTAAFRP